MCGIIGYTGHRPAIPAIVEGLRRLEYRGYDSAGVAYEEAQGLKVIRAEGKLGALDQKIHELASRCGGETVFFELEWNQLSDDEADTLRSGGHFDELAHGGGYALFELSEGGE